MTDEPITVSIICHCTGSEKARPNNPGSTPCHPIKPGIFLCNQCQRTYTCMVVQIDAEGEIINEPA
jgi:hypothetical protein